MEIFITGGTGFIGRHLCAGLLGEGHRLTVLSRRPAASVRALCSPVEVVSTPEEMPPCDQVVNLAGEPVLARLLRRPARLPAPAFALRLLLGRQSEILLGSQRAIPARLLEAGFPFVHPDLEPALRALLES